MTDTKTTHPSVEVEVLTDPAKVGEILLRTRQAPVVVEDPEAASLSIVERILSTEGQQALEAGLAQPVSAKAILGEPFTVTGVRWMASSEAYRDNGPGVFALIEGRSLSDGEPMLVTCGGLNVMAQLLVLARDNAFPQDVKIEEATKPTARGYRPLWIVPLASSPSQIEE